MKRVVPILLLALTAGCWSSSQSGSGDPSGTDADTDSDSDSDSDSDDTDTFPDPDVESGELMWAVRAGGAGLDRAIGLDGLPDGSCMVVGAIGGTAVFGPGEENQTSLSTGGFTDGFAARLNLDGKLTWVRGIGGTGEERALDVVGLDEGSAVVVGDFDGTAEIDDGLSYNAYAESSGGVDGFLLKYSAAGHLKWVEPIGGPEDDSVAAIDAAPGTGLRVVGSFSDTVVFGEDGPDETEITATIDEDAFVASFEESGDLEWVEVVQTVDAGWDMLSSYDASVAEDGTAAFIGPWGLPATYAPGEPEEVSLYDGMVVVSRYLVDGTLDWALGDGVTEVPWTSFPNECSGISYSGDGGVYFACRRNLDAGDPMEFGTNETEPLLLEGYDGKDLVIGRYDNLGKLSWVIDEGGLNSDGATSIAVLTDGSVAVAGHHGNAAVLGIDGENETVLETDTYTQVRAFVATYDSDGELIWATSAGGGYETVATAVARSADGCILVAGYFNGTAVFGEGEPHETTLDSAGNFDVFVAKYAP